MRSMPPAPSGGKCRSREPPFFLVEIHLRGVLAPNCQQSDSTMKKFITISSLLCVVLCGLVSCTTVESPTPAATTTTTTHETTVARPAATQSTTVHTTGSGY